MLTFLALSVAALGIAVVLAASVVLLKLLLLPVRLAFGVAKIACVLAAGGVLLLLGLPLLLVVIVPFLAMAAVVWGMLRLLAA